MFHKMLTSAIGAGCAAWLFAAALHFAFVQEYILLGETYETGATVHFAGVAPQTADDGHAHAEGTAAHSHEPAEATEATEEVAHDHGGGADVSEQTRNLWTVAFFGLVYVAYAMIMVAGFGLARAYGKTITQREGLLWGIAGFAAFQLAPSMGLAPELPGTMAADLAARQIWWWGTTLATATGLALLGYGRGLASTALAVVVLAAPHVIGAPVLEGFSGVAPPEVAGAFSARVLGVALAVWALMGWVAGFLWSSEADKTA